MCAVLLLHVEELNNLLWSPSIFRVVKERRIREAGHVACMGCRKGMYRVLVGKPEGKRRNGRSSFRCQNNAKVDLQVLGCGVWTGSSWRRLGTFGGQLWMRWLCFAFHKMWGIIWLAADRLASQEGLCCEELMVAALLTIKVLCTNT
jgi:hypothetical protein